MEEHGGDHEESRKPANDELDEIHLASQSVRETRRGDRVMKVIKNVTEHTGRFAVIIVRLVSILLPTYGKNIGEGCNVDNTSEQGICKHVRNCSVVYQQLLADKLPESICGYSGIDPIVCCPTPIPQTTEIMYIGSGYAQTSPSPFVPISGTKTCKAPPQPQNGHWKLHRSQCSNTEQDCYISEGVNLEPGSHLIYSCNSGYKIKGSVDVSCSVEGKWLNIPSCIEIRCQTLSTASINADCTYNNEWVFCDSPVLPGTSAKLSCRDSYQYERNLLSRQSDFVRCNENGQWVPEPIRCIPVCGIEPPNLTPLIVGGVPANITEFPWHASLYIDVQGKKKKEFFCGASIIQENLLITAAHCIYEENNRRVINPKKIYIATGNIFRDYESIFHDPQYVQKNQVKHIYIVCNYLGRLGNYIRDIAILELMQPFVMSSTLAPVCIDLFSDRSVLEAGVTGKVAGLGRTAFGESSAILQVLTVPYIPFSQCKSASQAANTQQYLTNDKFCGGYTNGSAVCDGDTGGGLVFKTNGLWYLRGIVSVSLGTILEGGTAHCDNNLYTLYTQVSNYIDWIQNVIANIKHNQSYTSCTIKT
ncbi:Limulus clotting factor C [Camponotus japonicus]